MRLCRVKTSAVRLAALAKREDGSDPAPAASLLNPRDAASAHNLIDEQKRLLEEKERKIRSLLAGSRMDNIGAKKIGSGGGSNPAAIYGIKRPAKKSAAAARPASASAAPVARKLSMSASKSSLNSSRGANDGGDQQQEENEQENEEPDFQAAPTRARNSLSLRSPSLKRSPSPLAMSRSQSLSQIGGGGGGLQSAGGNNGGGSSAAAGGAGESKDENHYLDFNKKLQERINSSQNFHRNAIGNAGGASGSGGGMDSANAGGGNGGNGGGGGGPNSSGRMGSSFFDDDSGFPGDGGADGGNSGGGGGDMNELVWIRRELRQKKAKIAALQNHFESERQTGRHEHIGVDSCSRLCEMIQRTGAHFPLPFPFIFFCFSVRSADI